MLKNVLVTSFKNVSKIKYCRQSVRLCQTQKNEEKKEKVMMNQHKIVKNVQKYGIAKYLGFVEGFEKTIENNFPLAINIYRVFMVGIKQFYKDLKHFLRIARIKNREGFKSLNRKEIELYDKMPKDMIRVAPVLVISALPFANYVIFPLAYMFPRQLLCSHFWSLKQKNDFSVFYLRRRLFNQRPVLRCMQTRVEDVRDAFLSNRLIKVLSSLGSGTHPEILDIISIKQLFADEPFHLICLYSDHVNSLLRLHNMNNGWRRRHRLRDRALILKEMDLAMSREGIINMSLEELCNACFMRGFNPSNLKTDFLVTWLQNWTTVSLIVDEQSLSMLLHCPILLAYNQPSNWQLIYQ